MSKKPETKKPNIVWPSTAGVKSLQPEVDRAMAAIRKVTGIGGAWVSDGTRLSHFMLGTAECAAVAAELGVEVCPDDYLVDVARRLRPGVGEWANLSLPRVKERDVTDTEKLTEAVRLMREVMPELDKGTTLCETCGKVQAVDQTRRVAWEKLNAAVEKAENVLRYVKGIDPS